MHRRPHEIELTLPYGVLVSALSQLEKMELLGLIEDVEDQICDWDLIVRLKKWVDRRHRQLAKERAEEESRRTRCCVQSTEYSDLRVHASPHVNCILR
jgi:hypothetical protein